MATATMQSEGAPLDEWSVRVQHLEKALAAAKREALATIALPPMKRAAEALREKRVPHSAITPALVAALQEIKACIVNAERAPQTHVFDELDQLLAPPDPFSAVTAPPPPPILTSVPAPPVPAELPVARDMLAALADGADDEVLSVLDNIEPDAAFEPPRAKDELGTLREPLGGARVLMKGELQHGLLPDLIQLFAQNRETGCLTITGDLEAELFLQEGQIVDAVCAGEVGERAFYRLMQAKRGRFAYQRGVAAAEVRITRRTQHLIMDTLRLIDEESE